MVNVYGLTDRKKTAHTALTAEAKPRSRLHDDASSGRLLYYTYFKL